MTEPVCPAGPNYHTYAYLAAAFFDTYADRLKNGKPQLLQPGRQTVMEQIVSLHRLRKLDRDAAIRRVEQEAFHDVIPRFHTVHHGSVATAFYEQTPHGLILTDALFTVFHTPGNQSLLQELDAHWSLLEGAFEQRREHSGLANDIRQFYLERGYE